METETMMKELAGQAEEIRKYMKDKFCSNCHINNIDECWICGRSLDINKFYCNHPKGRITGRHFCSLECIGRYFSEGEMATFLTAHAYEGD